MTPETGKWTDRSRTRTVIAVIVIVIVLALVLWLALRGGGGGGEEDVPAVVTAQTAPAVVRSFPITLSALGTVDARPGAEAQISAPAQTRVTKIFVGTGDRVAAGQPLVALDESVWAAQAAQAGAALRTAQQAYDRAKRLVSEGVAPRKDEEAAASDLAQARAALAEIRTRQSLGVLRSPISGIVTAMRATLSQAVDANQPLVEVVDPRGLEVLFHLSPEDAARVAPGNPVRLTSGPDSAAAFVVSGVVRGVSAAVDSTTGSVEVRATVTAPARTLRIGESIAGRITTAEIPNAVVVPAAAVVPADSGVQVFTVDAKGIARATPVAVGARTGGAVEITAGLRGGETVVTAGAYGVTDGARIVSGSGR